MKNEKTKPSALPAHSHGPWHVGERNPEDNKLPIFAGGERNPIAWVNPRPFFEDNQAANARLIATAPELLEALKLAIAPMEGMDTNAFAPYACHWLTLARAAIQKAEGVK